MKGWGVTGANFSYYDCYYQCIQIINNRLGQLWFLCETSAVNMTYRTIVPDTYELYCQLSTVTTAGLGEYVGLLVATINM